MTTLVCGPYRAELIRLAIVPPASDQRQIHPDHGDGDYLVIKHHGFVAEYLPVSYRTNDAGVPVFDEATVAGIERHFPLADAELGDGDEH